MVVVFDLDLSQFDDVFDFDDVVDRFLKYEEKLDLSRLKVIRWI